MTADAPESSPAGPRSVDVRRRFYASTLLVCLIAIAGIGVVTLWAPDLISSTVMKTLATLGIVAGLSTVFYLYASEVSESFGKKSRLLGSLVSVTCGAAAALALLTICQIWGDVFDDETFVKLGVTVLVIGGMAAVIMAIWDDFFENNRLKDQNYLD